MQPYGKSGSWLSFIFVVFVFCFLFFLCYVSKQRRWTKSKTKSGSSGHVVKFQILSSFLYFLSNKQSKFVFVLLVFLLSKNIDEIIYLVRFSSFILSINRFLRRTTYVHDFDNINCVASLIKLCLYLQ
jgi:Na+/melibiose symporter-like transporter